MLVVGIILAVVFAVLSMWIVHQRLQFLCSSFKPNFRHSPIPPEPRKMELGK